MCDDRSQSILRARSDRGYLWPTYHWQRAMSCDKLDITQIVANGSALRSQFCEMRCTSFSNIQQLYTHAQRLWKILTFSVPPSLKKGGSIRIHFCQEINVNYCTYSCAVCCNRSSDRAISKAARGAMAHGVWNLKYSYLLIACAFFWA